MDLTVQRNFAFPMLKQSEILQCMLEVGVELNPNEILEPQRHKDKVRAVFLHVLNVGLGISEEDLSNATPADEAKLPYPELHEDSILELKVLRACMKLMRICGLHDFGWKDLQAPTSKRFRQQLSGMINFAKYREDRLALYAEMNAPRGELLDNLEEVNEEHKMLNQQLEEVQLDTDNKYREMEEVVNDCNELEIEIGHQNKLQTAKRLEAAELKKKANDLDHEVATATLALQEAQAQEKKLSSQVVPSPERIKQEMSHAVKTLETERRECDQAEKEALLGKVRIGNVIQAERDVRHVTKLAEEVKVEQLKSAKVLEEVRMAQSNLQENQRKKDELLDQTEHAERTLHRLEEKIVHLRKQGKMKMDAAQDALNAAQSQLLMVEKDRRDGMARVEAGEAEVRAIEAKIEEEKKRTNAEIADMIAAFRKTEQVIREDDARLMQAIGAM